MKTQRLDACACTILAYKNYGLIPYNDISDKRGQGQISAKRARPLRISVYMKYIYGYIYGSDLDMAFYLACYLVRGLCCLLPFPWPELAVAAVSYGFLVHVLTGQQSKRRSVKLPF